jgi:pimeloyl-ACP methyl ester carboxylesterase
MTAVLPGRATRHLWTRGGEFGWLCLARGCALFETRGTVRSMPGKCTLLVVAAWLILAGCSAPPAAEFARKAAALGLGRDVALGTRFQHVLYRKSGAPTKTLHVYLDGDGIPWIAGRPAGDPTPRNGLVLRLLALDPAPAIYLGRPCYNGAAAIGSCFSHLWTRERYSDEVIASLSAAVRRLMTAEGYERVAWFGHSGGGTLAVLLAWRFPETVSVVTIAANLDTDAWAAYMGHQDLSGSLNPAAYPPLARQIQQRHYAGGKDRVVPPALAAPAAVHLGATLIVLEAYDHVCCWEQVWPTILSDLAEAATPPNANEPRRPVLRQTGEDTPIGPWQPYQATDIPMAPP